MIKDIITDEQRLSTYVWKTKRDIDGNQREVRLIDCSISELQGFLRHCNEMINHPSKGRMAIISILREVQNNLEATLFVRDKIGTESSLQCLQFHNTIEEILITNNLDRSTSIVDVLKDKEEYALSTHLTCDIVLKACIGQLGKFHPIRMSEQFLYELGVNFTKKDKTQYNSLKDFAEGMNIKLKYNRNGLSTNELMNVVQCKGKDYSNLTDFQVKTYYTKVVSKLIRKQYSYVRDWNNLIDQINEVLELKNQ